MGLARVITSIIKSFTGMFQVVELNEYKEVSASEIDRIEVSSSSTGVYLIPSEQDNMTMELKGQVSKKLENNFSLDVTPIRHTLNIVVRHKRRSGIVFGFTFNRSKLLVTVPKKWYASMSLQTSSGDIECEDLTGDTIMLISSSGDIRVKNTQGKSHLTVQASSGSIHATRLYSDVEMSLQTSSGDVHANGIQTNELTMKANSGDLNLRESSAKKTLLRTSSGEIRAREINGDFIAEASSGDIDITNTELIGKWNLKSSSGDVSVKLVKPESLSVNYKGGSGSGKVFVEGMYYQVKSDHSIIGNIGDGVHQLNVQTSSGDFRLS